MTSSSPQRPVTVVTGAGRGIGRAIAERLAADRAYLLTRLARVQGVDVAGVPASSFLLMRVTDGPAVRRRLRERGFAVRRGETFPGLTPDWVRVAVRDTATTDAFVAALTAALDTEAP